MADCIRMSDELRDRFERNYPALRGSAIVVLRRQGLRADEDKISELIMHCMRVGYKCRSHSDDSFRAFCYRAMRWQLLTLISDEIQRRHGVLALALHDVHGRLDDLSETAMLESLAALPLHHRLTIQLASGIGCKPRTYHEIAKFIGKPYTTTYRLHAKACEMLARLVLDADDGS